MPCFFKPALKKCFLSHALGNPKWQSPASSLAETQAERCYGYYLGKIATPQPQGRRSFAFVVFLFVTKGKFHILRNSPPKGEDDSLVPTHTKEKESGRATKGRSSRAAHPRAKKGQLAPSESQRATSDSSWLGRWGGGSVWTVMVFRTQPWASKKWFPATYLLSTFLFLPSVLLEKALSLNRIVS